MLLMSGCDVDRLPGLLHKAECLPVYQRNYGLGPGQCGQTLIMSS
jgi:hypothetical protein